ncbi:D-isomer specific 2-hydroxyacid dehydrogenase NAD-binding protein [Spirochaeta thermophila DSM 6578]|uniref:D-3-phosphoglycerate dehydrogenase n=1 Tax=Winmispira thermophila (strain ATCC 700085 / DSM 6578 / Z-1203) TaxID=869211 RepID=G0GC60_WINT7|nr:phosphoglycerate dehydrogenase [Spirochaeta thermophila]AEJ60424.1 D-isomer specific 2-hydroxyacid dehydrogenase NAD-binding protein [Spirochaeta thermophila DSM 6578]
MFKIQTLNKISPKGLEIFPRDLYEVASEFTHPDAILVRSADMNQMEIPPSVLAIARAGAGVNNIPVERCTERGIVVFNTPGANANSVKELVIAGLLIASRKIIRAVEWVRSIADEGDRVSELVEKEKSRFTGPEIKGKKLGVIGLGSIGVMVANAAVALEMEVIGYDPYISVEAAWGLSSKVQRAETLEKLIREADYITLHVPLNDDTRGMLNYEKFRMMKRGVKILNFARGGLVNNRDILKAIEEGIVDRYVTDFPEADLLQCENVIPIPHLGASTPEAEENCAIMAVQQLRDFLERGNIRNSVNFPTCQLDISGDTRILIANRNIPDMVRQITGVLGSAHINISDMINKHKGNIAYNIIDVDGDIPSEATEQLSQIEGVIMVRVLRPKEFSPLDR